MVDVMPTPAALPSSTASIAPSTSGFTAVPITVSTVAQGLSDITHIIQTNAVVVATTSANAVTLSTSLGNITVLLAQQASVGERQNLTQQLLNLLQTQRPLTLTLQPGSPPTQGTLLIPTTLPPPTIALTPNALSPAVALPPLAIGDNLPAIVLPPLPTPSSLLLSGQSVASNIQNYPAAVSALPSALPAGMPVQTPSPALTTTVQLADPAPVMTKDSSQILAKTTSVPLQAPTPQLLPSIPTNSLPAPVSGPPQSPQITALLQPGSAVILRVDAFLPSANANSSLPPLSTNQIVATVTGTGTDGQLILKAGDTTLFVKAQAAAPVGTSVILTVEPNKAAALLTLPALQTTNFQALTQAVATLAQTNPQVLQQLMNFHIPQPTEALPGALLLLFSAFKQGNVRSWLGNSATDALTRDGTPDIINKLSRELSDSGQLVQDPVVGEWKSFPIPLYAQQQFQALTLYVHNDRNNQHERAPTAPQFSGKLRFLIDMRLSKLGALQVDGFVQPKKLDMILRSETLLPEGLHNELRLAYIKAVDAVGYTGTLNFQVGHQHWMVMQRTNQRGIVT
jgi:hypothetical protein